MSEGGDLGSRLKSGPLKQGEALRLVKEICAALEAAHAQGVIHRDIKPSNILLTADGSVKVADFGLAIHADQPEQRITRSGVTLGTFEYAAPEQAAGTAVDPRSDLYSVGVICYEVLTGKLPRGIFDPPSKVNAAVDPAMDEVVRTAMQNDPARRYQTATDFRAALNRSGTPRGCGLDRRVQPVVFAALVLFGVGAIPFQLVGRQDGPFRRTRPAHCSQPLRRCWVVPSSHGGRMNSARAPLPRTWAKCRPSRRVTVSAIALRTDGTVTAWGRNQFGQVNVPWGVSGVQASATGGSNVLALKADGTVVAWGANDVGQASVPAGLAGVQAIAAGNGFSAALKSDGTIVVWGSDANGLVSGAAQWTGVKSIAAGDYHMLAVQNDGTVVAWGDDGQGRTTVPAGLTGVRSVAAGWFHSIALKEDGTVVAWGTNDDGQTSVPAGLQDVQAISAGYKHSLALKSDGTVVAWGISGREAWGDRCGQTEVPAGLAGVKAIAAGAFRHSGWR